MKFSKKNLKKATRKHWSGRRIKPSERVIILKDFRRRRNGARLAMVAVSVALGAARVAAIQATHGATKIDKAIGIANATIDSAHAVGKAMQSEPIKHPFNDR